MSLKTWKREFYRKPASEVPIEEAVSHSLRKWQGLTRANLRKHKVINEVGCVVDKNGPTPALAVDNVTCSLCQHYLDLTAPTITRCSSCPLSQVRGGVSCCTARDDEVSSPFDEFCDHGKIMPMLKWLRRAEKFVELRVG